MAFTKPIIQDNQTIIDASLLDKFSDGIIENANAIASLPKSTVIAKSIVLGASSWVNFLQSPQIPEVTATNNVIVTSAPVSFLDYRDCGVRVNSQGAGYLTFKCEVKPTENITVNILILP